MLKATRRCLEENQVKLVLAVGDQMYTDHPAERSLFDVDYFRTIAPRGYARIQDCPASAVRGLLHERYRHFWNFDGWRQLHADYPCYPILDDHELVDNWGSDPAHSATQWQAFEEGAWAAYYDYQHSRICEQNGAIPTAFDHGIFYGPVSVYTLDLHSNRQLGEHPRIYSREQEDDLAAFLERHAGQQALFIALSVPIVHLPQWMASLGRVEAVDPVVAQHYAR